MTPRRLDNLEQEILSEILEYIADSSPRTIPAVALTNKYIYLVYRNLTANRRVTLVVPVKSNGRQNWQRLPDQGDRLIENQSVLLNLRILTVEGPPHGKYWNDGVDIRELRIAGIVRLIKRLANLRVLTWNDGSVPLSVLEALHSYQPRAKLQVFNMRLSCSGQREPSEYIKALARSPALTHLRVEMARPFDHVLGHTFDERELPFRYIVARARNLLYAGLLDKFSAGQGKLNERYEEDQLGPYLRHQAPRSAVRMLTLDGFDMSQETLDDWSAWVDLSALETIKFTRGHMTKQYFELAATMMPNLKHVYLNLRPLAQGDTSQTASELKVSVSHYLTTSCAPLTTLSVWSWRSVPLEDLLKRHHPTLTTLALHEREGDQHDGVRYGRRALDNEELRHVVACPCLRDLTIDMDRTMFTANDDNGRQQLSILRNTKLDRLQIYFDMGIMGTALPPLNAVNVQDEDDDEDEDDEEEDEEDEDEEEENGEEDGLDAERDEQAANSNTTASDNATDSKTIERESDGEEVDEYGHLMPWSTTVQERKVREIWRTIFGSSRTGARVLTVKFGEWETYTGQNLIHEETERSFVRVSNWTVRPQERDDRLGECTVWKQLR